MIWTPTGNSTVIVDAFPAASTAVMSSAANGDDRRAEDHADVVAVARWSPNSWHPSAARRLAIAQ